MWLLCILLARKSSLHRFQAAISLHFIFLVPLVLLANRILPLLGRTPSSLIQFPLPLAPPHRFQNPARETLKTDPQRTS